MASYLDKTGLEYLWGKIKTLLEGKADSSHNHAASAITSGTLSSSRLPTVPVTKGGTGATTAADARANLGAAAASHGHSAATTEAAGFMSADDKAKLDGIASGANAYSHPAYTAKASGLYKVTVDGTGHVSETAAVAKADITALGIPAQDTTYGTGNGTTAGLTKLYTSTGTSTDGTMTRAAITTALNGKEASGAAATALTNAKAYTDTKISDLINSAPTTLDTLGEIATAMEENAGVVEALESAVGSKAAAADLTSHTSNKSNPHGVTLAQLGVTATAAELNALDGITATVTELNYMDGVTSNVQTQLNGKAASSHNHSAANITSGTLAVARGGTGVTANPSLLVNLGSTTAAGVFAASPRPGVTGTLPIANGGTGATTADGALTNLGITSITTAEIDALE